MGPFDMLQISGSALSAERQRSEVIAANMANAETTHTDTGGPFKRKEVVFSSASDSSFHLTFAKTGGLSGKTPGTVRISQIVDDTAAPVMRYEPGHPDADKDGFVAYPAINPVQEMVDLMGSTRAYQLNASAVSAAKQMIQQSIDILKS
ncbi:flagellar basal body rod protein FlgC [Granulicella tundricola]|uniref:Flagellar basal-body rod protein FlgC n=1 Tax=Granulicella tundricola (strain ATCC BAA-1859 / DSM 23138 / MP5ACTX9) TaxID=1198114 RepID=E8X645_GRATM|nr:flagellar basal body rod protein FlgC [Granulicella tundricola]ADW70929.1 flagellar basal-body rod protein FlgC [Granulicella tundricola MP5ACTX9]